MDLSARTQTKRNVCSRFFCADKNCKEFLRRGKKKFGSSSAGAQTQHQNHPESSCFSKSSCPTYHETQRIFIWYLPCVPRAFLGIRLRQNQSYNHSPEQAGKFPVVSRVNADYPGSYHLHSPDREELQLFQTMWLIPTEANPPDQATCGNWIV